MHGLLLYLGQILEEVEDFLEKIISELLLRRKALPVHEAVHWLHQLHHLVHQTLSYTSLTSSFTIYVISLPCEFACRRVLQG